ncbi:hypothetical protein QSH57_010509 [Fusarium oxysporum f. sp. vasinfectum]|nr:hypothetical protein QSH57_010509 [Fusarium oxysporum f. sp. vasinfectum]
MEQFEFHPATTSFNRVWSTIEPGVDELVLNEDSQTGRRTTLQRWQPGARNQQDIFIHDYVEEIFMVEGDLYDQNLQQGWEKGAYAYRKPGMRHGPFKSERGCLMFIVCIPVDTNEAQEKTLSQSWFYFKYLFGFYFTGKTWSTSADAHMSDKFVALEQDKCLFMYLLARSINAKNIVEAGTSFGVSTMYLALAVGQNVNAMRARDDKVAGRVIATEWESSKAERARKHWSEAGEEVEPWIELREGDLRETLSEEGMPEEIDMMLLDTWIPMALPALEIIKPRLKRGAMILADNTKMAKALYKEFLDYIHDPKNGFKTTTTAYSGGLEMIVYLP